KIVLLVVRRLHYTAAKRAIELLRATQERFPADYWINYQLAQLMMLQGNPEGVRFATAAVALRPEDPQAWLMLGLAGSRPDDKIAACRKAIALAPDQPGPYVGLGQCLSARGQTAEAAAVYRKAIALDPFFAWAHNNLGLLHWAKGQTHDEAIAE